MPASVYIETSVVSYLVARRSNDIIVTAHQQITARWWKERRPLFALYVSELVLKEAGAGDADAAQKRLAVLSGFPVLRITEPAATLAGRILTAARLPNRATADAFHVAVAAVHGIHYLLTWNVRHIANAEVRRTVEAACRAEGYAPPVLCTPEELMGIQHIGRIDDET